MRSLLWVVCLASVASAGEWTVEEVGEVGMYSDLVVAPDGTPHVALCGGEGDVVYATRGSGGWTRTAIAKLSGRAGAAQVAIALDDGRPAILFASDAVELWTQERAGWEQAATWATWQGNGECQLVLAFADGEPLAFCYDPYKEPAIQVAEGRRLRSKALAPKAKDGGGLVVLGGEGYAVWQEETEDFDDPVVIAPRGQPPTAIVTNTVLRPRVATGGGALAVVTAARAGRQEALTVHTRRGDAWTSSPGLTVDVDQGPWFALGPDAAPHVLFTAQDEGGERVVVYATLGPTGWRRSEVQRIHGTRMALQVDGRGRPHVLFANQQSTRLFYATPSGELSFDPARKAEGPVAQGERPEGAAPRPASGEGGQAGGASDRNGDAGQDRDGEASQDRDAQAGAKIERGEAAGSAAKPLDGDEAAAIAREVRERAERWFDLRAADALFCSDCDGSATQRCRFCRGTLKVACPPCRGEGRIALPKALGERQRYKHCSTCKKKGELDCEGCDEGLQPCSECRETPRYRGLAGFRAFWRYVAPSLRNDADKDAFVAAVLRGERLAEQLGPSLAIQRARITAVDVYSHEVVVTADVVWAGEDAGESSYRSTWFREDGRFYLATGSEDRPPLVDPRGARPAAPSADESGDAPSPAQQTLNMAANYVQNGAYRAALRKLEGLDRATLDAQQQARYDELLVACQAKLGR